jgi:hypothetical protein
VARSFRSGRPFYAGASESTLPGMDLDAAELRVLGCLIEKQRTTPDV